MMELEAESCRQRLLRLLLLLGCVTLHSSAIETVNVVDFCGQMIRGDGMIINSHQESKKYYFVTMATDCHLTMQASSPKDKVQFHFRFFLVYSLLRVAPLSPAPLFPESPRDSAPLNPRLEPTTGESPGDPCHAGSYVQFYDGWDRSSPPLGPPLCGKSPPRPVLSTGNYLTLRLVTRGTQPRVDFVGDFTSFRLGFNQSECSSEPYFTCRNGKCIPLSLVCDDKGIDNCGDGSDLEENLTTGCEGQLLPPEPPPPIATPPPPFVNPPTEPLAKHLNCGVPDSAPSHESVTDSPASLSLLVLYIILAVVAGGVLLCWCCWSPGWFLWRVSICRFLPCCNLACASCQLCGRSCVHSKEHRLAKVTPHTPVNGSPTCTAAATNSAEENITTATV
ncbi:low-density lipoprotein receptor class A domain-containing protein 2 [Seriola lalandi dorsalis]|uniref:low-density lipoprotein receptor class A domain-containing protein 2 n=1 Tax=Seriola lalandi dorsalis TaxID=1841481 RepID=UPI000C6F8CA9|nr:low-density lipoprotein receptor class A domain-containing protein 2 [Seriola lalandi dorsalis]XP_056221098.1 low-density lipoprotein receptor class A domain-containing protein 2 isoform X3 [Seriola aureovittata]